MSQVTRCPSCETRFKVVADQLRISQGWVRCGVCQSVFDASEDLQILDAAALSAVPNMPQAASEQPLAEAHAAAPVHVDAIKNVASSVGEIKEFGQFDVKSTPENAETLEAAPTSEDELAQSSLLDQARPLPQAAAAESAQSVEDAISELDALLKAAPGTAAEAQSPNELEADSENSALNLAGDAALLREQVRSEQAEEDDASNEGSLRDEFADELAADASAADLAEPGFVRQARRQAFWHSTPVRAVLLLGSLAAVAGLLGQYVWQQRDAVAAQYPELRPALSTLCKAAGCQLQPRREIADVVISSSGFKQLADANEYQWSLSLENRSATALAMPVAELTLTDAQDKPLLRRVIDLQQLGAPLQLLPGQEWSVSVPVQLQELSAPVAGYRALVFYP